MTMDTRPLLVSVDDREESTTSNSVIDYVLKDESTINGDMPAKTEKKKKSSWSSWAGNFRKKARRSNHQGTVEHITSSQSTENIPSSVNDEVIGAVEYPSRTSSIDSSKHLDPGYVLASSEFESLSHGVESLGWDEPSTTKALDLCKKYILNPYNALLKVIGWRSFRSNYDPVPWHKRVCNIIYPMFIFLMLMFACSAQVTTCFSRSRSEPPKEYDHGQFYVLNCDAHVITGSALPYLLIIAAYVGAFYIFRIAESEHLSSLSETVFLSYNYTSMSKSRRKPVFMLLIFIVLGLLWIVYSFLVSILRFFALRLYKSNTYINWFLKDNITDTVQNPLKIESDHYERLHYTLTVFALLTFVFFDLLYLAVILNYSSQCQLLTLYIENIKDKVQNKKYRTLNTACQELYHVYEFLKVLNGKVSLITTLILFIFISNIGYSYMDLMEVDKNHPINIVLGCCNLIQWIAGLALPVAMAVQLTAVGKGLTRLGLEIASRPFAFKETPDLELQLFLNYTEATRFTARLAYIPMYPAYVAVIVFILLLLYSLHIIIPSINSIPYF